MGGGVGDGACSRQHVRGSRELGRDTGCALSSGWRGHRVCLLVATGYLPAHLRCMNFIVCTLYLSEDNV